MIKIETFEALLEAVKTKNKTIWELTQEQEAQNSALTIQEIRKKVFYNILAMEEAIKEGVNHKEKSISQMCGEDCFKLKNSTKSLFNKTQKNVITYAIATAEQNAIMGKIVACPTAGSCGIIPSVLVAYSEELHSSEDEKINALLTSGMIGKIISNKVALAGAVMGCQGECGVASAMASGALVQMYGGNEVQVLNAVALVMKNIMGLTCDPVAGLVEVPCIKRNAFLAITAITGAELALSDITSSIPVDEVIDAVKQVGMLMSPQLKESSEAGLAVTRTGIEISERMKHV